MVDYNWYSLINIGIVTSSVISMISCSIVLLSLFFNRKLINTMSYWSIVGLFVNDLLCSIIMIPFGGLYIYKTDFLKYSTPLGVVQLFLGETIEYFFASSGIWSVFIAISIYSAIQNYTTLHLGKPTSSVNRDPHPFGDGLYEDKYQFQCTFQNKDNSIYIQSEDEDTYSSSDSDATMSDVVGGTSDDYYSSQSSRFLMGDDDMKTSKSLKKKGISSTFTSKSTQEETANLLTSKPSMDDIQTPTNVAVREPISPTNATASSHRSLFKSVVVFSIANGIPLIIAVILFTAEAVFYIIRDRDSRNFKIIWIITDQIHNFIYIIIEMSCICVRYMIYRVVKFKLFQKNTFMATSEKDQRVKKETKRYIRRQFLYAAPFLLTSMVLICARLFTDVQKIINLIYQEEFSTYLKQISEIMVFLYHILMPLRGFLDAVIYCYLSPWFYRVFRPYNCARASLKCCYRCYRRVRKPFRSRRS